MIKLAVKSQLLARIKNILTSNYSSKYSLQLEILIRGYSLL